MARTAECDTRSNARADLINRHVYSSRCYITIFCTARHGADNNLKANDSDSICCLFRYPRLLHSYFPFPLTQACPANLKATRKRKPSLYSARLVRSGITREMKGTNPERDFFQGFYRALYRAGQDYFARSRHLRGSWCSTLSLPLSQ